MNGTAIVVVLMIMVLWVALDLVVIWVENNRSGKEQS